MAKRLTKSQERKASGRTGKGSSGAPKAIATKSATAAERKAPGKKGAKQPARERTTTPKSTSRKSSAPPPVATKTSPAPKNGVAVVTIAHTTTPLATERKNDLKAQFAKLSSATSQISGLKRALNKNFYDVGTILNRIRDEKLYEVKGYGSFESFVEREIDINKAVCLKSARIAEAITRDEAVAAGLERASAAVAALDGELESANLRPVGSPVGSVPLHKQ